MKTAKRLTATAGLAPFPTDAAGTCSVSAGVGWFRGSSPGSALRDAP